MQSYDWSQFQTNISDWLARSQDKLLKSNWTGVAKDYPYVTAAASEVPFSPFNKKLKFCRVTLITGAALYLRERQEPFNVTSYEGDFSFRSIPKQIFSDDIEICHEFGPTRYAKQDINCVLPLERLRKFEEEETIGELSERSFSINDFITRADKLETTLATNLTNELLKDEIDVAIFLPFSELGHQTMGLIERQAEIKGINTICVGTNRRALERVQAPRSVVSEFPEGTPFGEPGNEKMQKHVFECACKVLRETKQPGSVVSSQMVWQDPFA